VTCRRGSLCAASFALVSATAATEVLHQRRSLMDDGGLDASTPVSAATDARSPPS
jgi:hypothetical protein